MKKSKNYKILSIGFIIIGLLIIIYPKASELYRTYQQQKLLKEWQQSFDMIGKNSSSNNHIGYDNYNEEAELNGTIEPNNQNVEDIESGSHGDAENVNDSNNTINDNSNEANGDSILEKVKENYPIEGILMIDKIDLKLPILTDATENNMKISVASIKGTGKPGQIGNYSIAGHRSHTYGRNFNRLNEVKAGDLIKVDDGNEQFSYEVTEKLYVKPDEVWVLESNGIDKEITLVTCHPMINPTHRLIIKGKIKE